MLDDPLRNSNGHATYSEYLDYVNRVNIPVEHWLTYDQYTGNIDDTTENLAKVKLGFTPGIGNVAGNLDDIAKLLETGIELAEGVGPAVKRGRQLLRRGLDAIKDINPGSGRIMDVSNEFGDTGGGDYNDGGGGSGPGKFSPFDTKRLNLNPKPIEVRLDTGIKPNTYGAYYLDADTSHYPLHLTGMLLSIPDSLDGKLYTFYDQVLTFAFQNAAQSAVSFNLATTSNFTAEKLRNYLNAVLYALQVFYFYSSIITYCDFPANRNQGMLALRSGLSAEDLDSLYQLKRILEGTPIPPNLNNLCFYLMQTYKESSLPGSALIKCAPIPFASTAAVTTPFTSLQTGLVDLAISKLADTDVRYTTSLIARVAPDWLTSEILAPSEMALHDLNFNTIWSNLPGISYNLGLTQYSPKVTASGSIVTYNSYADILDGASFALTTTYFNNWLPGLVDPGAATSFNTNTSVTNRISYYTLGGVTGFYAANLTSEASIARDETYIHPIYTVNAIPVASQKFGTEAALNVSINTVRETCYQLLEWMITISSIKSKGKSGYKDKDKDDKPKRSRGNRGKGKGKGKGKSKSPMTEEE